MISPESSLAVLIVALYVADSVLLVHANEGVFASPWEGKWVPLFGSRSFTLAKKGLLVLSVLYPSVLVFKLSWSDEHRHTGETGWECYTKALRPIQALALVAFITTVVAFPVAVFARAGDSLLIGLLVCIYASSAGALLLTGLRRKTLGVSRSTLIALAVEALVCPSVAANIARKLSLQRAVPEDLIDASRRLLDAKHLEAALVQIGIRLQDEIEFEEEGSERSTRLRDRKAQIE